MRDQLLLQLVLAFGTLWVTLGVCELSYRLWNWSKQRESITDRWIREDMNNV